MIRHDIYLALLALACAVFIYAAAGRHQPARVLILASAGLAVVTLAVFLHAAGWL